MVIEPPCDPGRGRVFEVYDCVLVASKLALVEQRARTMHKALILIARALGNTFTVESSEQRGRAGSVKTFVVVEDANPQNLHPLVVENLNDRNC